MGIAQPNPAKAETVAKGEAKVIIGMLSPELPELLLMKFQLLVKRGVLVNWFGGFQSRGS